MSIFDNIEKDKIIAIKTLEKAKKIGIEKVIVSIGRGESHELNVHSNIIDLFRTTFSESISITGYIGHKKGSIGINCLNFEEIETQLDILKSIINSSFEDNANELVPFEDKKEFSSGNLEFSKEEMVVRLEEFIEDSRKKFPIINLEEAILDYSRGYSYFLTSNGTEFLDKKGKFSATTTFSSREKDKVSSFNFFSISKKDLKKPILEWENVELILKQNTEQIDTKPISDKFEGSIIFTPNSVTELISFLIGSLKDYEIISGTSIYKNKVNSQIASNILTIESNPTSELWVTKGFWTSDGFLTKPITILEKGVLKTLLLSYYGSLKTGKPRALNYGSGIIIKGKTKNLDEIIKNTKKGILLERISGGEVSPNGDFSAVAKNSYFIKDGQITYPIKETMISGNYAELLKNITDISCEYVNDGYSFLPYIKADGATISGK
ncbi:MAG TPA: metallopeptidase TldD-related protein [Exilispira sp.]|nr:metallopeptidase TldD-related protein [Exilispira sp.]